MAEQEQRPRGVCVGSDHDRDRHGPEDDQDCETFSMVMHEVFEFVNRWGCEEGVDSRWIAFSLRVAATEVGSKTAPSRAEFIRLMARADQYAVEELPKWCTGRSVEIDKPESSGN